LSLIFFLVRFPVPIKNSASQRNSVIEKKFKAIPIRAGDFWQSLWEKSLKKIEKPKLN